MEPLVPIVWGMNSEIASLIEQLGGPERLAGDLDPPCGRRAVAYWPQRGIPNARSLEVLRLARRRGVALSESKLLEMTRRKCG